MIPTRAAPFVLAVAIAASAMMASCCAKLWAEQPPSATTFRLPWADAPQAVDSSSGDANRSASSTGDANPSASSSGYANPSASNPYSALPPQVRSMWWNDAVMQSAGIAPSTFPVAIETLICSALAHSSQIQALLTEPEIRRASVAIEQSQFDWTTFLNSRFDDSSDPIGSILQTGSADGRYLNRQFTGSGGVRQSNRYGGNFDVTQHAGNQRNNSEFLIPNPQGTTRLELNYTQPLLNGRGSFVNESSIVLARLDLAATDQRTQAQIQDHLIQVTDAYWNLYLARSQLLQRRKLLYGAMWIRDTLKARQSVDVMQRQILRANVAVSRREADVIRAQTEILNAQSHLRTLVNDPALVDAMSLEWIPQDMPLSMHVNVSTEASSQIALATRPEIAEAMRRVKAMSLKAQVAKNDLLPRLDLILKSYVAGLQGNGNTLGSWGRQFSVGRPTYGAGLVYEFPIHNRAARGRMQRAHWELNRELHRFELTLQQTAMEVDIAVREIHTSYRELVSKQQSVEAAQAEVNYLVDRWRLLPTAQDSAILLLENLLEAQRRLGDEESAMARANVNYARSWIGLRRSMGTLLQMQQDTGQFTNTVGGAATDG